MRIVTLVLGCILLSGCLSAKPHDFTCGDRLNDYSYSYEQPEIIQRIRRDSGGDYAGGEGAAAGVRGLGNLADALQEAFATDAGTKGPKADGPALSVPGKSGSEPARQSMLMLSGGGHWGAFGAGFLAEWNGKGHDDAASALPNFTVITGISTGAMQSFFVAADEIDRLKSLYTIEGQGEIAAKASSFGLMRKGSQFNTAALKELVEGEFCRGPNGACPLLEKLAEEDRPKVLIGMVETTTGDLIVVDVTQMLKDHYAVKNRSQPDNEGIGECVAGIAMASSSVPVQLTPVRIDEKSYTDGGVRSSVFAPKIGRALSKLPSAAQPTVYVIRNGPTVVPPMPDSSEKPGYSEVDVRPDALAIAQRSFSTVVNQNELSSIALLRDIYSGGPMNVVTADGFNSAEYFWPTPPTGGEVDSSADVRTTWCSPPRAGMAFDPEFMRCMITWGERKLSGEGTGETRGWGWISLEPTSSPEPILSNAQPTVSEAQDGAAQSNDGAQ